MKEDIRKAERRYLRQRRLQKIREARRLARLNVFYNPNKKLGHFRINREFRVTEPFRGKKIISFPSEFNFDTNADESILALNNLHNEILYGDFSEIFLDHTSLNEISPEAAVVLLAELKRCTAYASRRRRIRGNYPKSVAAAQMLTDIGFYRALNVAAPSQVLRERRRMYFKVISGNQTDGRIINELLSTFEQVITFDVIARKRLYGALTECMDNVRAHAYKADKTRPDLLGEWWMAGFCDLVARQVAFIFFDQGLGIPTTLKSKLEHRVISLLSWGDSDLIQHAVEKGMTKEASERHGTGLPSLKGFINELSAGGFLRVMSNYGDYTYYKNEKAAVRKALIPLEGSLVTWSIQQEEQALNRVDDQLAYIDLTAKQQRLPL